MNRQTIDNIGAICIGIFVITLIPTIIISIVTHQDQMIPTWKQPQKELDTADKVICLLGSIAGLSFCLGMALIFSDPKGWECSGKHPGGWI